MDSKKSPLDFFRTALLTKGRGDGRPARERDWCGKVTDELPRLAPPRVERPGPSLRRRAGVSPAGEKLSISGETPELHPTPSKFFQNSATPFHALLALFLLLAATFPAFAQVPAKVTLSRANTPTADGFTVAWSDLSNETAYHLEHTTSANFTTSTLITNISANATSRTLTGLTPGTTYYVRVRGAAAGGNGTWSDVQANQLLSIDPGQTRYLSVAGVPHSASHSVNFTISDIFGSANAAGLASAATSSEASTILLLGSNGSTAHTVFYNSSQNQWREGDTNKGGEIVGFGKGFMVKNNASSTDIFLLSGAVPPLESGAVTVFAADAPAGRLSLVAPSRTMATSLRSLGLTFGNNTTTGLKRATVAKDADLLLIPDSAGGLRRYHFDGTNWRSGLRTVSDPASVTVPAGGAFFLRKASGSSFEQWRPPSEIVTDGLILYLDSGNPDSYPGSGTVWRDLSGNGNNATLSGGPTFSSDNGGVFVFDGVNDYASLSLNLSALSQITVEAWVRSTGNGGMVYEHSSNWNSNTGSFGFGLDSDGNTRDLTEQHTVHNTAGAAAGARNILYTAGTTNFHSFTKTFSRITDSTGRQAFVNGALYPFFTGAPSNFSSSTSTSNTTAFLNTTLFIGSRGGTGSFLNGRIAVLRIYNRKLSASEVQQNYAATKRRFEDPDATAYLNAVEAADGQALEPDVRDAVDKFVRGCKADGIWSAIKASCILAGARTLNGALVPLVGTAPTNYNFVSGDYNRKTGMVGDGSTKYLNSNRNNNADPQNNQHLGVFVSVLGSTGNLLATNAQVSGRSAILHSGTWSRDSSLQNWTIQTGFLGVSRQSSTSSTRRIGGTTSTINTTSNTPQDSNLTVFAGTTYTNHRISFYSIGESLDLAKLDSRVSTLLTDLAAAIP